MSKENADGRIYAFGYSPAAVGMMDGRTAAVHAGFLLPKLEKGVRLLDIGCGPGSITIGLAEAIAPGEAVGIDIEPSQIDLARSRARERDLKNCHFEVGSVLALPFPDDSFDVVFGHTILMQFRDTKPVLEEVKRVLKPGGIAAFRDVDFGASLYGPSDDAIKTVMSTLRRSILENDGYPDIGRDLPMLLAQAGLTIQSAKPTYSYAPTPEARAAMYQGMSGLWRQADFVEDAIRAGWLTEDEREATKRRLDIEVDDPSHLQGITFVEVIALLPG